MSQQTARAGMSPSRDAQDSGQNSTFFPLLMVGVLLIGVTGVLLFGPAKTVQALQGLIGASKSAPINDAAPEPVRPKISPRTTHSARRPVKIASVTTVSRPPEEPRPAPVARQLTPRSGRIRAGMLRQELLEMWGAPDIKLTTVERGNLIETYSYIYRPQSPARTVVLEEGRVTSTDDISVR